VPSPNLIVAVVAYIFVVATKRNCDLSMSHEMLLEVAVVAMHPNASI
jgi:hypothetical protein